MSEYRLKTGKIGEKVVGAYEKVEKKFVDTFLNEDGSMKTGGMADKVTSAYQKIEDTVVGGYKKIEDSFVDAFLEKVEDDVPEQKKNEETVQENTENQSE